MGRMKLLKCLQNLLNTFYVDNNGKIMKTKQRSFNYDVMRILMSIFVIAVHTPLPGKLSNSFVVWYALSCLYMQCNGVFFMISGRFNLMKAFQSKEDYIRYYKSKFVTIFVPFCLATAVIVWSEHQFESNPILYIKNV